MFEDKKTAVLEKGKAERNRFNPDPDSAHFRLYKYFLENGGTKPVQENFCHYWRVVVIWAPLMALANAVERVFTTRPMRAAGRVLWKVLSTPFLFVNRVYTSIGTRQSRKKFWEYVLATSACSMFAFFLIVAVIAFINNPHDGLIALACFVAGVAVLVGLLFVVGYIGEKRDERKRKRVDAAYEYYNEHGEYPVVKSSKPSKIRRFFSGVLDFAVLLGNIVRVKKWKICPLVTIPEAPLDRAQE